MVDKIQDYVYGVRKQEVHGVTKTVFERSRRNKKIYSADACDLFTHISVVSLSMIAAVPA